MTLVENMHNREKFDGRANDSYKSTHKNCSVDAKNIFEIQFKNDASPPFEGINHPSTLFTKKSIAICLMYMGKYNEALEIYYQDDKIRTVILGINHPSTLATKDDIARCLSEMGKHNEGLETSYQIEKTQTDHFVDTNLEKEDQDERDQILQLATQYGVQPATEALSFLNIDFAKELIKEKNLSKFPELKDALEKDNKEFCKYLARNICSKNSNLVELFNLKEGCDDAHGIFNYACEYLNQLGQNCDGYLDYNDY